MESFLESTEWISAHAERAVQRDEARVIQIGEAIIDSQSGKVSLASSERWLRGKELELLAYLYAHMGVTFTRPELLECVWNYGPNVLTRTVDQTVATLRRKIEKEPEEPKFLQTVYGVGYRLMCEH